jgi:glycosyltransferase involved in cell wall biosynthesis
MRILILSEAFPPQVNGVVRTFQAITPYLVNDQHIVEFVFPEVKSWRTWSWPFDRSVKLEFGGKRRLRRKLEEFKPDCIHMATEGPFARALRSICIEQKRPFTTSFHTRFPEYIAKILPSLVRPLIEKIAYAYLRRFHAAACAVMVTTPSMKEELEKRKFRNLRIWPRGVDLDLFKLYGKELASYENLPRPIMLYFGRVAAEKNIPAFLDITEPGSKVVIGDGPQRAYLEQTYPDVHFLGEMSGEKLARHVAAGDVFVFPSKTDTFGLVLVEAAASGLPIAAYPVPGPIDILSDPEARPFSVLHEDLGTALREVLKLPQDPEAPRRFVAERYSWKDSAAIFVKHLQEQPTPRAKRRMNLLPIIQKRMNLIAE